MKPYTLTSDTHGHTLSTTTTRSLEMNSTKAQEGFRLHVASGLQYELLILGLQTLLSFLQDAAPPPPTTFVFFMALLTILVFRQAGKQHSYALWLRASRA